VEVHLDQGRQTKNDTHLLLKQLAFVFCVVSAAYEFYVFSSKYSRQRESKGLKRPIMCVIMLNGVRGKGLKNKGFGLKRRFMGNVGGNFKV
jgi:hypothetical protein